MMLSTFLLSLIGTAAAVCFVVGLCAKTSKVIVEYLDQDLLPYRPLHIHTYHVRTASLVALHIPVHSRAIASYYKN